MLLSKLSLFLFPCIASVLYQLSMPFEGWPSILSAAVLTVLGHGAIMIVMRIARSVSAAALLNAFLSTIIGFGATTFLVFCAERLSHGTAVHPLITPIVLLILLCASVAVSYIGLQAIPVLRISPPVERGAAAVRKFIPDQSVLEDGRIVDLARAGLLDGQIIIPSFLSQELRAQSEIGDESSKVRAKKAFEALRRLEGLPHFSLQSQEIAIVDAGSLNEKLSITAKRLNAALLTNEPPLCRPEGESSLYLTLDAIASALRPAIPKGEVLSIKIQRLGKEAKQGIGYLEDGTMVVVNGGEDYLGRTVRTQVLSQKDSSSGRKIIFCNVRDEEEEGEPAASYGHSETAYGV